MKNVIEIVSIHRAGSQQLRVIWKDILSSEELCVILQEYVPSMLVTFAELQANTIVSETAEETATNHNLDIATAQETVETIAETEETQSTQTGHSPRRTHLGDLNGQLELVKRSLHNSDDAMSATSSVWSVEVSSLRIPIPVHSNSNETTIQALKGVRPYDPSSEVRSLNPL